VDSRCDRDKPQARGDWWSGTWRPACSAATTSAESEAGPEYYFFLLEVEADLGCELDQDQETGARTQRIATRFAVAPNGERYGVRERGRRPKGSV
jgi:hypothetical protein